MRARFTALVVAGALVVGAAVVGVVALLTARAPDDVAAPSATRTATPTRTAAPTPTPSPTLVPADVPMAVPERVEVPDVGIDLTVRPIDPVQGRIDPPSIADAFWIEDYGLPGTDAVNTVYLVGHSSLELDAAFNPLLDVEHQQSVLEAGDTVLVTTSAGVLEYAVTGWERYGKASLPEATEVWAIAPGTLHLITCFQEDGQEVADDNLVVTARLVGGFVVDAPVP